MDPFQILLSFPLNFVDFYLLFLITLVLSHISKPPKQMVFLFLLANSTQVYLVKTILMSRPLAIFIAISCSAGLLFWFFGWKITHLSALIIHTAIGLLSEGTVILLMSIPVLNTRAVVLGDSIYAAVGVVLARSLQCIITVGFLHYWKSRAVRMTALLPRYILLGLIIAFLLLMCILFVYIWALENEPVPEWFLILYMVCTVSFIGVSLVTQGMAIQGIRDREERKLIDLQGELSLEIHRSMEQLKEYEHNYRKNLQTILALMHEGMIAEAENYYGELVKDLDRSRLDFIRNMPALSATIQRSKQLALQKGISMETSIPQLLNTSASEVHLCVIFSNLLENAIEASAALSRDRWIRLRLTNSGRSNHLHISVENSYDAKHSKLHFMHDLPVTTKTDRELHGYGLRSVKRIVRIYHGTLRLSQSEAGIFQVEVVV